MDPGEVRSVWAYALLDFYILQGAAIMFLLRSWEESTTSFRLVVHGADIVWPALISLFTTSQSNPFFLFFVFVIAAAAYRWGLWETLMTAISSVGLLWLESLMLRLGRLHHLVPIPNLDTTDLDPQRLFMRSAYLVVMGLLLGYLAEQQKRLRAEREIANKLLGEVRMDTGLAGSLSNIVRELLTMYHSPKAIIASRESSTPRISVGIFGLKNETIDVQWIDAGAHGAETYLSEIPGSVYALQGGNYFKSNAGVTALDSEDRLVRVDYNKIRRFAELHPFQRLVSVPYSFGRETSGRIFLIDPMVSSNVEEELLFIQDLVRQMTPAVYNLFLLRRLRRRAGALERARIVRELHDGAVQSLIGVEMQVDVLRRSYPGADAMAHELKRIQQLLREEVLKLRELMQQMKSADMDGRKLPGFLRDAVQKFQRETGIAARLVLDDEEIDLPPHVCRELARIAQEALVNVRKHSGAANVSLQMLQTDSKWELIIEDDGAGFPFTGRVSQANLDSTGRAPAIIRERVRLIEGELTIESKPGRGSRVEVSVAASQRQAAYG
jgi:signal transduction histidine kinase